MTTDRAILRTKTTNTYWWNWIGDTIERIIVIPILSLLLSIGYYCMTWYTKKQQTEITVVEENGGVTTIVDTEDAIDPKLDGKLVHITGFVKSNNNNNTETSDNEFGMMNIPGIIKLHRTVELYQWIECPEQQEQPQKHLTEDNDEEEDNNKDEEEEDEEPTSNTICCLKTTETKTYRTGWGSIVIDTDQFGNNNDDEQNKNNLNKKIPFIEVNEWTSSDNTIGVYKLSSDVLVKMKDWYVPLQDYNYSVDTIPITTKELVHPIPIHVYRGDGIDDEKDKRYGYFIGTDPNTPQIGDIRITYKVVPEQVISIIGQVQQQQQVQEQNGCSTSDGSSIITSYTGPSDEQTILLVQRGTHNTDEMFQYRMEELTKRSKVYKEFQRLVIDGVMNNRMRRRSVILAIFIIMALFLMYVWLINQYWFILAVLFMVRDAIKSPYLRVRILYVLFVIFNLGKLYLDYTKYYHQKIQQQQQEVVGGNNSDPTEVLE